MYCQEVFYLLLGNTHGSLELQTGFYLLLRNTHGSLELQTGFNLWLEYYSYKNGGSVTPIKQ